MEYNKRQNIKQKNSPAKSIKELKFGPDKLFEYWTDGGRTKFSAEW
jgi:hypothetical protein